MLKKKFFYPAKLGMVKPSPDLLVTNYTPISKEGIIAPDSIFAAAAITPEKPEDLDLTTMSVADMINYNLTGKISPNPDYARKFDWKREIKYVELPTRMFTPIAYHWIRKIISPKMMAEIIKSGVDFETFREKWPEYCEAEARNSSAKNKKEFVRALLELKDEDGMFMEYFPIPPLILRPILVRTYRTAVVHATSINQLYMSIMVMMQNIKTLGEKKLFLFSLQDILTDCGINAINECSAKKRIIWERIMGGRLDYGCSAVVIPKPASLKEDRAFEEIVIPASLFAIIHEPVIFGLLQKQYSIPKIMDMIYNPFPAELVKTGVLDHIEAARTYGGLNRPPAIMTGSTMSKALLFHRDLENHCIAMDTAATTPSNADFDGDALRIQREALKCQVESFKLISFKAMMKSPTSILNKYMVPQDDYIVGLKNLGMETS